MSIHIEAALSGIVNKAVNTANSYTPIHYKSEYRPFVESCVVAETAELRVQLAELKFANLELKVRAEKAEAEIERFKGVYGYKPCDS